MQYEIPPTVSVRLRALRVSAMIYLQPEVTTETLRARRIVNVPGLRVGGIFEVRPQLAGLLLAAPGWFRQGPWGPLSPSATKRECFADVSF